MLKGLMEILRDKFRRSHCWRCGSSELNENLGYTRGYNNLCQQACGSLGKRCFDCGFIHFETPYYRYVDHLPHWCKPSPPRPGELFYDAQRATGVNHYPPKRRASK